MNRSLPLALLLALPVLLQSCQATAPVFELAWAADDSTPIVPGPQETANPSATPPLEESAVPAIPVAAVPVSAGTVVPAAPEHSANIYRKMGLRVGGVAYGSFDTTVQVNSDSGIGAILDFEDLLGVSASTNVFRMDAFYAFNDRHRIDFGYYDINRTGTRTLAEDVQIGDVIIPAGDTVSTFGTNIMKLNYRYNFVTDPRTVLAGSFGFHVMKIDLGLRSPTFAVEESFGVTAPLPVFGLHGAHALSSTWSLYASGEIFQIEIEDYGGTLSDFRLGLAWDVFEHVGLGFEMNSFNMGATVEDGPLTAEVEYGYSGFGVYLRGYL